MTASLRPATTVLLLRPAAAGGLEVFLVKRHKGNAFMPSAWVFPGGRVDPADGAIGPPRVIGGAETAARLHLAPDIGRAFLVAGVRETFEEAGIWLGSGAPPDETRPALARGEVTFADLLDAHDATVDLDALHPWAWWVTPEVEPKRYDTRFVIAFTDAEGTHDDREVVDSGWFSPSEVLARADAGGMRMAPPTWWTIKELASLGSMDGVIDAVRTRQVARIQPMLRLDGANAELVLPGHDQHPDGPVPGLPRQIRLVGGRWWADEGR